MKHCNKPLEIKSGNSKGKTMFYAECGVCGLKWKDYNKKIVEDYFKNHTMTDEKKMSEINTTLSQSTQLAKIPNDRTALITWSQNNMIALMNQSAQFIDKPATQRMIEKNVRYVSNLSGKAWDKVWNTDEGQESITHGFSEALYYGAILGEMGDLVPFGNGCEFIASVECYENAMSKGKNPPFSDIEIKPIYENDTDIDIYQKDGSFHADFKIILPRGELAGMIVRAKRNDTGKYIGEAYDVKRLLEKAAQHSPSYKNYILDVEQFNRIKSEGNLKEDKNGHKYFEKVFDKRDGGTWSKKIYEHDLVNPYDGPDRPEMLRKAAGKSFFRPYMKVRNASAMAEEWSDDNSITDDSTMDQAADHVLNVAKGQFETKEPPIKDAEIIKEKEPVEEKEVDKNEGGLFNEDKEIKEL